MAYRGGLLSNFFPPRNFFIVRSDFTLRGNRFFAPLEASGELLILYLFNYKYSLVSKTVFRLFLRRLVPEIFDWVQIFKVWYPVYIRRDRDKNISLCEAKVI